MQKTPLSLAIASAMVVGAALGFNVKSVSASDAGVQLNQIEQQKQKPRSVEPVIKSPLVTNKLPKEKGPSFKVTKFEFVGNEHVDASHLQFIADEHVGDSNLQELSKMALKVTQFYRVLGYSVARAYIPPQEISGGVVKVGIIEGRIGQVVKSAAPVSEDLVVGYLHSLKTGDVLTDDKLERALLLLNDLPGVKAQARLKAGANPGETDVAVEVTQDNKVQGNLSLDNHGTETVGEYRLSGNLYVNNPLKIGDQLALSVLGAEGGDTLYGSVDYSLPIGSDGWRAGVAYSNVDTEVGESLAELGIESEAEVYRLYATYPLIRSRKQNLLFHTDYRYKTIESEYDPLFSVLNADETLHVLSLGLNYDRRDDFLAGGVTYASLALSGGLDDYDSGDKPSRLNAEGDFTKAAYRLARLQNFGSGWSAYLNIRGQESDDVLPASEQFSLGGAFGVRAYDSAFALGDSGVVSNLELRYQPTDLSYPIFKNATVYAFYDYGITKLNGPGTEYDLGGLGLGVSAITQNDFSVDLSYATKVGGDKPDVDDDQLWLRITKWFN